ncbi:MAG: LuxR C-terminal-related transcriptional regulator, partial [Solirubrobacteraceae bacterium]|nr:LuxR C-terminal-related transcriptional regulator [Solirubrobacteraceae bacterium]
RAREVSDGALPYATAMADRAEAHVALVAGDADRAVVLARRSVEAAKALGAVVEAERGRLLLGRALIAAGERDAAADELREAEATLLRLGADRLHADAIRELRRIGRRPNREGRAGQADPRGSGALSPREREVAGLAAENKTNREIAAVLFLSEKTIETHMAGAFLKLGVKSRRALAAALAEG